MRHKQEITVIHYIDGELQKIHGKTEVRSNTEVDIDNR